jgi:hypothetical protein
MFQQLTWKEKSFITGGEKLRWQEIKNSFEANKSRVKARRWEISARMRLVTRSRLGGERGSKKELGRVRVEKMLGQLLNVGASVGEELIITAPQGCGYCWGKWGWGRGADEENQGWGWGACDDSSSL